MPRTLRQRIDGLRQPRPESTSRLNEAFAPIPACRTAWSASARRTACCSSTTARRPMPRPRRRRWRLIPRSAGSWAGRPRRDSLGDTAAQLGHVVKAYTIGEAGPMFARLLRDAGVAVEECETLEIATKRAAEDSHAGDVVLLSPASASFDQFRDFEARGDRFRDAGGGAMTAAGLSRQRSRPRPSCSIRAVTAAPTARRRAAGSGRSTASCCCWSRC